MDLDFPEEMKILRDSIRRFVDRELIPINEQVERTRRIPDAIVRQMKDMGLFGILWEAPIESVYREVRGMRIYEGTSEIQRLIIARDVLKNGMRSLGYD